MTEKEKYAIQEKKAKLNEDRIKLSLKEHPKTFTELKNEFKLSPRGLSKILERMESKGLIQHPEYSKAYELTRKGMREAKVIPLLEYSLDEIISGKYSYKNHRGKSSLGYKGISYDTIKDINVRSELFKFFNDMIKVLLNDFDDNIGKIPEIIESEDQLKGKMIFAFTIDFDDMKKQFLKRYNKDWLKFGIKWENEEAWSKLFRKDDPQ